MNLMDALVASVKAPRKQRSDRQAATARRAGGDTIRRRPS
jgi:hypothetical protein